MLQPLRLANSSRAASPFEMLMVVSSSPCEDQYAMCSPPVGSAKAVAPVAQQPGAQAKRRLVPAHGRVAPRSVGFRLWGGWGTA